MYREKGIRSLLKQRSLCLLHSSMCAPVISPADYKLYGKLEEGVKKTHMYISFHHLFLYRKKYYPPFFPVGKREGSV